MADIKAIETWYQGYRMRSRLEARWAIFFDNLDIKWEYETEGFRLSDGTCYLPDFYLPTFGGGTWVEVKPTGGDFSKARAFARECGKDVWLCEGVPDYRVYSVLRGTIETCGLPNADQAWGEDRMYWMPGYENENGTIPEEFRQGHFRKAINAAKSARFEHGEQP